MKLHGMNRFCRLSVVSTPFELIIYSKHIFINMEQGNPFQKLKKLHHSISCQRND